MKKLAILLCLIGVSVSGQLAMKRQSVGSKHVAVPTGGGGGPDAWYYTTGWIESTTGTPITGGWAPESNAYGNDVVVGSAGTATTISVRMSHSSTAVNVKIALFDSGGTLVANGTGATATSDAAGAWVDVSISAAVSAATYYVHVSSADANGWAHYVSGATDGNAITRAYASFPQSTETINVESGNNFGVRIYVD